MAGHDAGRDERTTARESGMKARKAKRERNDYLFCGCVCVFLLVGLAGDLAYWWSEGAPWYVIIIPILIVLVPTIGFFHLARYWHRRWKALR